jgi:predicted DNA repair protein MutK
MSGLLALFDDVAAIAKLAATQLDDVAAQAGKAGTKAAGVVIDDAAVTPKYVTGLPAARELPIVWKIARASFFNKLVILLPAALLLNAVLPWMLTPLLMLGGAYLCFEGAEKVWHLIVPHEEHGPQRAKTLDAAHLEEQRVKGAIKTDFILSAEIMTISLAQIDIDSFWIEALALAAVAIGITALVYGAVALLVKADDLGWHLPYEQIKHAAAWAAATAGTAGGLVTWGVTAGLDGIIGLAAGLALIPVVSRAIVPVSGWLFPEKA